MLYLSRENLNHLELGVLVDGVVSTLKNFMLFRADILVGGVVTT